MPSSSSHAATCSAEKAPPTQYAALAHETNASDVGDGRQHPGCVTRLHVLAPGAVQSAHAGHDCAEAESFALLLLVVNEAATNAPGAATHASSEDAPSASVRGNVTGQLRHTVDPGAGW